MTIKDVKYIIENKLLSQMIIMESAIKNNNYNIAYETVNLAKAYITLIKEIQEGENNASIK